MTDLVPYGPGEIVRVPFHGQDLLLVDTDGQPHIVLKPAIEGLGLDYATQYTKLRRRSWACVGQRPMQLPSDTQSRPHVTVDVRTFLMLLATVDENRVPEHVRPLLIAYQREVADVIESYWTKGAATRPGVEVGPQHEVPQTFAEALRLAADNLDRAEAAEARERELANRNAELEPKAEALEAITDVDGGLKIAEVAQIFDIGPQKLFNILYAEQILQRGNRRPYSKYLPWFRVVYDTIELPDGTEKPTSTTYVRPEGVWRLYLLLTRRGHQLRSPKEQTELVLSIQNKPARAPRPRRAIEQSNVRKFPTQRQGQHDRDNEPHPPGGTA